MEKTKTGLTIGATVLVLCLGLAVLFVIFGGFNNKDENHLASLLASSDLGDVQNVTDQVCEGEIDCVEAWRTDSGMYLRFASDGLAEEHATYLGDDGRRSENFVLDMRDTTLNFDQKKHAIQVLFSDKDWG